MNPETVSLLSLGECDAALQEKVRRDIERIAAAWVERNMYQIGSYVVANHQVDIERIALRALKNHLNNASNLY